MRRETKLNKLAAILGMDAPVGPPKTPKAKRKAADTSREAEAVLSYHDNPRRFTLVVCRSCGEEFYVSRANVSCCSDRCRAKELLKIGIEWDWTKDPSERWGITGEPLVVKAEIIEKVTRPDLPVSVGDPELDLILEEL